MLKLLASLLLSCCIALAVSLSPAAAMGVYDLPILSPGAPTYVVDPVAAISAQEVRMVVVRRLDYGQKIDNLADDILREWYPNSEDRANQTIIVLDTLTNKTAIRVGEEAKPLLTDAIADSILSETMAVPLKDGGKYNQALLDASRRLTAVLSGEPDPGPPEVATINIESTFTTAEETDDKNATIWVIVLLVLATVIPMVTYFWYAGFGR